MVIKPLQMYAKLGADRRVKKSNHLLFQWNSFFCKANMNKNKVLKINSCLSVEKFALIINQ